MKHTRRSLHFTKVGPSVVSPHHTEGAMRALAAMTVRVVLLSVSTSVLSAQRPLSAFDGVWREVERRVVRPDSTIMQPVRKGVRIILNGHFSQIWVAAAAAGVEQAGSLKTAETKAARYDALTSNAGMIEVHDSTFVLRYEHAKDPTRVGQFDSGFYRLVADTLWNTGTSRWAKDTTKLVRITQKFVRVK